MAGFFGEIYKLTFRFRFIRIISFISIILTNARCSIHDDSSGARIILVLGEARGPRAKSAAPRLFNYRRAIESGYASAIRIDSKPKRAARDLLLHIGRVRDLSLPQDYL